MELCARKKGEKMDIKKDFPILENKNITYLDSGATTQKPDRKSVV